MIDVQHVAKTFWTGWYRPEPNVLLEDVSFQVQDGEVLGLIGPNGVGKTTLFRMAVGLERPTSGRILVDGLDPFVEPEKVRERISLLPEKLDFYQETGLTALKIAGALYGFSSSETRRRIDEAIDWMGLAPFLNTASRTWSRGQAIRVALAREHVIGARHMILDEPTVGLDFESAAKVRAWVATMKQQGRSVLIATHIVSEITSMCDRWVGLKDGRTHNAEVVHEWVDDASRRLLQSTSLTL